MARRRAATSEERGERAQRILEAADVLFCERGFDGTSMRDVAERADVNKGLIVYYFANKAGLFAAVLRRYYEAHLEVLAKLLAKGGTVGRKLDFLAQEFFREANTVGSKCSDAKVAHAVVDLKTSIERLREQVQNLE